jgi:hypothetical protein
MTVSDGEKSVTSIITYFRNEIAMYADIEVIQNVRSCGESGLGSTGSDKKSHS